MAAAANRKKRAAGDNAGPTVSLNDTYAQASKLIETSAIVRRVASEIVPKFYEHDHQLPAYLLRRANAGPRPASIEAIVEAEAALEELARRFDEKASELLELRVVVPGTHAPANSAPDARDETITRESLELEFKTSAGDKKSV